MINEETFAVVALIGGVILGVFSLISAHRKRYLWCLIALVAAPLVVLFAEFSFFPSSMEGVTSLTGLGTMKQCSMGPLLVVVDRHRLVARRKMTPHICGVGGSRIARYDRARSSSLGTQCVTAFPLPPNSM